MSLGHIFPTMFKCTEQNVQANVAVSSHLVSSTLVSHKNPPSLPHICQMCISWRLWRKLLLAQIRRHKKKATRENPHVNTIEIIFISRKMKRKIIMQSRENLTNSKYLSVNFAMSLSPANESEQKDDEVK